MIDFSGQLKSSKLLCRGGATALLAVLGLASAPAKAQQASTSPLDSIQSLPNVRVQGIHLSRFAVGSRVSTLDSSAFAITGSTVADALAVRTPLYLKEYGPGQLASIAIRGTSAQHTAVLWNGFNIMLPTLGQNDFALLPLSGVSQVAVQHGPAGGTYGTGAVGGTLLLSAPAVWGAGPRVRVQADAGSYGLRAGSVEGSFSNQRIAMRTAASYRTADNDFPYEVREITGLTRYRQQNAAQQQWSFAQDATLRVGQQGEVQASVWLTEANREIQPSIGSANSNATQHDQSRRLLAGYRHVSARHESGVRVAWFEDVLDYLSDGVESFSQVRTTQAQADHTVNFKSKASLRGGVEAQHFAVAPGLYRGAVDENRFAGYLLFRYDPHPVLHLSANLRQAILPGRQVPLTPTVGAEWEVLHTEQQQVLVKASASRSYRAPTLNERYWPQGGNPDLRPESGYGYEAGLQHSIKPTKQLKVSSELTAFQQLVDDWVEWRTDPRTSFISPNNLRQVRARGLEASSHLTWRQGQYQLQARASYALTQSEKTRGASDDLVPVGRQLAYVPLHTAALTTDHSWRRWQVATALRFTGYRYVYTGTQYLPAYALLNATVSYTLRLQQTYALTVTGQGFNLTNTSYQTYEARAMPPRWGSLGLRLQWR
ncbi:TonB-dependent receptor [Hymenobacter tibetensis]|uniref:TonB-dependent receptor n=1 Tax=Hymenobacter tibetensis TaxID=497967 RepID=A0ABY4CVW4_9BACT|nr:TonB-dependent receptor [Hymenobacter tibetensis]UOG74323.1 TonB-dependent receptor [Hymenobacter tibetensis]